MTKHKYLLKKDEPDDRDFMFSDYITKVTTLPTSVDLRNAKMPKPYNQLSEGSCTGQGGTGDREYLLDNKTKTLSRQFLYNVERILEGTPLTQDGGCQMRTVPKAIAKYGICEESYLPYTETNLSVTPSEDAFKNGLNYTISAYHRITSADEVRQALAQDLPVLFGITVMSSFESKVGDDGFIPMPLKNETVEGGHCTLLVGYKNAIPKVGLFTTLLNKIIGKTVSSGYFILRNSWSANSTSEGGWGDHGYGYLPFEVFEKIKQDIWVITK